MEIFDPNGSSSRAPRSGDDGWMNTGELIAARKRPRRIEMAMKARP
jgi:hypothetical protein